MTDETTMPPVTNIAERLVMIDFDATILPWGPLMGHRAPFDGVAREMWALKEAGYRLAIFTSRLSPTWMTHAGTTEEEQRAYIEAICEQFDIPFDLITAEKLPAEAYFDDKAYRVEPGNLAKLLRAWRNVNAS